jgi:hypothetical protein
MGALDRTDKETTMFKTISAAVLATSLLAAPAMAGTVVLKTGHPNQSFANARNEVVVIKKHRHHRGHRHVVVKKKVFVAPGHRHVVKRKVVRAPGHRTVIVKRKHI